MFKKRENDEGNSALSKDALLNSMKIPAREVSKSKNTILKGNKLIGDISVSCDLELSGEIEGNITSEDNSNILIKGICRGNITSKEGSIDIEGELIGGNISAGNSVNVNGKFEGGEITARNMIRINGTFKGKLEANEIEVGPESQGTGEIFYKDSISIAKGANIEGQICKLPAELTLIKNPNSKEEKIETPSKEASGA